MAISRRPRTGPAARAENRATNLADETVTTGQVGYAAQIHDAAETIAEVWLRSYAAANERVSPSQLRALVIVDRDGPLPVSQLADSLGAMVSSASRLCDRLVAAGLVERQPSPVNRRLTLVQLSRAGQRLLADIKDARVGELRDLLRPLSATERDGLLSALLALGRRGERDDEVRTQA